MGARSLSPSRPSRHRLLLCLLLAVAFSLGATHNAQQVDHTDFKNTESLLAAAPHMTRQLRQAGSSQQQQQQAQQASAAQQRVAAATPNSVYTPMDEQQMKEATVDPHARQPRPTTNQNERRNTQNANVQSNRANIPLQTSQPTRQPQPQQQQQQQQGSANNMRQAQAVLPAAVAAEIPAEVATTAVVTAAPVIDFPEPTMSPRAAQLSPSVLLMGYFDWQNIPDASGKPWSRCLDMVWRARRLSRGNKLNFVPTHHWIPGTDGFGVQRFCMMYKDANDKMVCGDWTQEKIDEFEDSMTLCFVEAFRNGFTPYLRPHLDDGYARGIWRNGLLFNPTQAYGEWTYKQIMLDPLAKALSRALAVTSREGTLWPEADKERPRIYIGLQGEMSATIMRYTPEWMSLIPELRSMIGTDLADLKFGIGLNFNALDATEYSVAPRGWGGLFSSARYPVPSIDATQIYDMITNTIDFIGISAYAPYTGPGMTLSEFENSAFNVADSLRSLGNVDLRSLIDSGKIELHYSEFGIGGGNEGNSAPAVSARMAGKQPWAGVAGFYRSYNDPWMRSDLADYRTEFYTKTLDWLAQPDIKTYKICDVFVWGTASWDLFALYPDSSNAQGSYRDNNLVQKIAQHNKEVVVSQVYAAKDAAAAALVQEQLDAQDVQFASVFYENLRVAEPAVVRETTPQPAAPAADTTRRNRPWGNGFFG